VQLLELSGVRVVALDYNKSRLDLATFGRAELTCNLGDGDPAPAIMNMTNGMGCDGVLIAAATESSEPFSTAAAIARDRAKISLVGLTGTEIPYREFMAKELSVVVSRSYGPGRYDSDFEDRGMKYPEGFVRWTETRNLAEAVRRMSRVRDHRLAVEQMITHSFDLDEAEKAYAMIVENSEPHLGVVLRYPKEPAVKSPRLKIPAHVSLGEDKAPGACVLGAIGGGSFARTVLFPERKKMPGCTLQTIATQRGASAEHSQEKFGFMEAAADEAAVLDNPDINAVLIATRHSSHGDLTARALLANKNVLVEKPLALDRAELNAIVKARRQTDAFFQVGFNRRYAPLAIAARDHLEAAGGNRFVLIRVNAGPVEPEIWFNAPEEGGGRVLGEACHFVDLARYFVGAPIVGVHAGAARVGQGVCDDLTITLNFADGGLATIAYTALGDTAYSKELIECYAGGAVVTIDDFRRLTVATGGKVTRPRKSTTQDKGHAAQLKAFVDAVASGGGAPVDEAELFETSLATIAVMESLQTGETVKL
jgi:predicted dehydrogenase